MKYIVDIRSPLAGERVLTSNGTPSGRYSAAEARRVGHAGVDRIVVIGDEAAADNAIYELRLESARAAWTHAAAVIAVLTRSSYDVYFDAYAFDAFWEAHRASPQD